MREVVAKMYARRKNPNWGRTIENDTFNCNILIEQNNGE